MSSMSELDFDDLPDNDEGLQQFLKDAFAHAEKLLNSLPYPASSEAEPPSDPTPPGKADTAADTLLDASTIPASIAPRGIDEQKGWGKPIKINAKDNPLKVHVYKMASHDRHGAWFARRSVHTGVGFERMKRCMEREFLESLKVQKGPGSGAVRGIAGDSRLEKRMVPGVGKVELWQLSSAFPGPVTPREFVAMVITGDNCLTTDSAPEGSDKIPRGYVTISRPSHHKDAQPRTGLVMGTYESVELVREIPLYPDHPESNPVEWTMITRSEPGGGIPKFLVERGTPGSIVADVAKWLQWAIDKGDIDPLDEGEEEAHIAIAKEQSAQDEHDSPTNNTVEANKSIDQAQPTQNTAGGPLGYLAMARDFVQDKASGYLPYFAPRVVTTSDEDESSSLSASSDEDGETTYASADEATTTPLHVKSRANHLPHASVDSGDATSLDASPSASTEAIVADLEARRAAGTSSLNSHEKELLKLSEKRRTLDARIAKSRADDEARAHAMTSKEATLNARAAERHEREVQKQERRYREQLDRLEQQRAKEARKIEERRRKAEANDEVRRLRAERDDYRERCTVVERENDVLRRQTEALQRENTALVAGLGGLGLPGEDVVRLARAAGLGEGKIGKSRVSLESGEDSGHSRATSVKSGTLKVPEKEKDKGDTEAL